MNRPSHPIATAPADDDFRLAWLRRTDALADPLVRAKSLCGEIARATLADRVSYLTALNSAPRLVASSLTTAIDTRSAEADWLRQIAGEVCRTATEFSPDPQLTNAAIESGVAVETLAIPVTTDAADDQIDAVIVLQRHTRQPTTLRESLAPIRHHIDAAASDVATAWRSRAVKSETRGTAWWRRASLWQRLAVVAALGLGVVGLLSVPVRFRVFVEGRLEPVHSSGVFAPASGTLVALGVADGEPVAAGRVLAEITNLEIELQQERLAGELAAAETELASLRLRQSDSAETDSVNSSRTAHSQDASSGRARQMVLRSRIESLQQQNHLIDSVTQSLTIRAPIDGRVVLRDEQTHLVGQSIAQSQWLMQIVDPTTGYHAIMDLPEKDDSYLRRATTTDGARMIASLRLLATPAIRFSGEVTHLSDTVQLNERGRPTIGVTVAVVDRLPEDVHAGATVVGTIDAGTRSLGFVWFRPLVELLRSYGW